MSTILCRYCCAVLEDLDGDPGEYEGACGHCPESQDERT